MNNKEKLPLTSEQKLAIKVFIMAILYGIARIVYFNADVFRTLFGA